MKGWGGVGGHVNVPCFLICNDFSSLDIKELVPPRETASHLWLESLKPPCHASLVGSLFGRGESKGAALCESGCFPLMGLALLSTLPAISRTVPNKSLQNPNTFN